MRRSVEHSREDQRREALVFHRRVTWSGLAAFYHVSLSLYCLGASFFNPVSTIEGRGLRMEAFGGFLSRKLFGNFAFRFLYRPVKGKIRRQNL
jgi:hypothetical protein